MTQHNFLLATVTSQLSVLYSQDQAVLLDAAYWFGSMECRAMVTTCRLAGWTSKTSATVAAVDESEHHIGLTLMPDAVDLAPDATLDAADLVELFASSAVAAALPFTSEAASLPALANSLAALAA